MELTEKEKKDIERKNSLKFVYHEELPKPTPARLKYLREQVKYLKTIPQPDQRTPEWYAMRESMVTASDFGSIMGDCPYKDRESVLLGKIDTNKKFFTSPAMMFGTKYEEVANMIYQKRNNIKVHEFGCIRHHTFSFIGASPDGITDDGVMVEIKCPTSREITGIPPKYYWHQMQGQLEVAELDRCDFLECKLVEISEEEYLQENYKGDYTLNRYGMEKGVVAEVYNMMARTTTYEYSPIGIHDKTYYAWKKGVEQPYINHKTIAVSCYTYWILEEVSCVPVYRDQHWLYRSLPHLDSFWMDVLKYRKEGLAKCKADIAEIREKRKQEKLIEKEKEKQEKEKDKPEKTIKKKNGDRDITDFLQVESVIKKEKKEEEFVLPVEKKKVVSKKEETINDDELEIEGCLFSEEDLKPTIIYDDDQEDGLMEEEYNFGEMNLLNQKDLFSDELLEEVVTPEKKTKKLPSSKVKRDPLYLFADD